MINFKKYQVVTVFVFLFFLLTPSLLLAQDSNEVPFDKLKTPTELQDIIDNFDRLKYDFMSFKKKEKTQELVIEFQYQGKEDVDGVQADKILIDSSTMKSSETSQMEIWLDEGEIVKMIQNEQEIPPTAAESMKDKIIPTILFPFYYFEELYVEEIASKGKVTRTQEMIGEKEVDIIKIESDDLEEYGFKSGTVKLADFEEFMMMVSFAYIISEEVLKESETNNDENYFEVKEIELR